LTLGIVAEMAEQVRMAGPEELGGLAEMVELEEPAGTVG